MSEIRVDTISEKTSANGVAIDSVTLKDGQVDLADSKKILLGNSDDLQLYHDGTDTIINNATGTLKVQADSVRFQNAAGNETIFGGTADGAAFLVHNDATKITTTANGVTVTDGILVSGSTPTLTIGDAGAEDTKIVFDGNAVDFVVGLDDSADEFRIGVGSGLGSDRVFEINSSGVSTFQKAVHFAGTTPTVTVGDGGAEDATIIFDGNAQNFYIGLDDSTDKLTIGLGSTVGTFPGFTMDENTAVEFPDNTVTIISSGNHDMLTLKSTDADAGVGPVMAFVRDSASPANGDFIGAIVFDADDSGGNSHQFVEINAVMQTATNGSEDGRLRISSTVGGTNRNRLDFIAGETVFNEDSVDVDFRVESDGSTHQLFVDAGNGRVGIGTSSPDYALHVRSTGSPSNDTFIDIEGNATDANCGIQFTDSGGNLQGRISYDTDDDNLQFLVNTSTERMRINSSGDVLIGTTSNDVGGNTDGIVLSNDGDVAFRRNGAIVVRVNRFTNDGTLIDFLGQGSVEGSIDVSGSTVSYNGFTGSHWSRLADNSKPTILRGTIMESIDEMCDWYQAVAEVAESTDDEGNVIPAHTVKESISLGDKSVGDAITFTSNGTEYSGTIVKEDDVKHTKCKVSDTADSKKVYGIFSNWDDADDGLDGDVNDMNIAQVGTFIIRVHKDVTVEAGDLLVSNGDGTAKLQDDDIIRSKTVAKVNSNIKIETYSDGSYTVPCTLHC